MSAVAAEIARLAKERDESFEDAKAYAEAARIQRHAKERAIARAERAESELAGLREALEEIVNPISGLQKRADAEGHRLNGLAAVRIAKDAGYLQGIARAALANTAPRDEP